MNQKFPKYTTAATDKLLKDLQDGKIEARDKLIERNARLVLKIAHKFIWYYKDLEEEIEEVAMRNLTERLESIRAGKTKLRDSNLGAYLNKTTVFRIQDFINKERKTLKRKIFIIDHLKKTLLPITYNDALCNLFVDEIMESDKFTEREKTYIQMKLSGELDIEIAKKLGVSKSTITWVKRSIEPKLKEFL